MEVGLQVHTEGGNIIQLDSNYNNFRLIRRIRVVGAFNSPKAFVCLPDHLYAVCAAKYGDKVAIIPKFTTVNGEHRQTYAVYGEALLYEFTLAKRNPSLSGVGMELYAEDGSVNYSSNDYSLKVIDYKSGDFTGIPINSNILDLGNNIEVNADTPRRMFVPGLIPIRYTGREFKDVKHIMPVKYLTGFYQVSTLFFLRELVSSWEGTYRVAYNPFYYKDSFATNEDAFANSWNNSSFRYSFLVIDTSTFVGGLPPIELYP